MLALVAAENLLQQVESKQPLQDTSFTRLVVGFHPLLADRWLVLLFDIVVHHEILQVHLTLDERELRIELGVIVAHRVRCVFCCLLGTTGLFRNVLNRESKVVCLGN